MTLTLNESLDDLQLSGIRRITAKAKQTPGCILLTLGEPDGNTAEAVKSAVAASLAENDTHYPPNNGKDFLRAAIARRMARDGLSYAADEVIVTCGATEALFAALTCVMNPGDEIVVPTPAFGLYESIVTLNRGVFVPLDTSESAFQITDEALARAASDRTKALVLTSPNNPTGCVYDERSLDAVARFARERDVFVICDDVYASLVYDGGSYRRFAQLHSDLRDRIIVCDSFSKPYAMTGWRLGWVAADAALVAQMAKIHQYMVSSVPSFVQRAAARALEQDISSDRDRYRARRDYVLERLAAMGLSAVRPAGAFYVFPSIARFGMPSEEFCLRLIEEAGVALVPGSCFSAEGYVRLSYCCSMEAIEEGLDRLEDFVRKLEGGRS
ncbi:MAG: aminotransferase class I/II-fold pyridoxal phosphate-dependent enzyme [Slackia sp.]|nr:aminotransferase class I/II-fold pyridoxal phosphate-dependent enzyme [Slackia sp.]